MDRLPVLVVEDEALIRMLLVDALEDIGRDAIEAESADAAVALLAQARVAAVITDIRMPGTLDGMGLARWLAQHRPEIPVIVTSGFVDAAVLRDAHPGRCALIDKPYAPDRVVQLVDELIAGVPVA